jgi:hypothetical protein
MGIRSAYEYFFYRTYVQQTQVLGDRLPKLTALLVSALLLFFNLLTLILLAEIFSGYKVKLEISYGIIGSLLLLLVNYFLFLYRKKDESIISKFSSETEIQMKRRRLWCWIYEIGTFVAFFASVLILSPGTK